ncbi:GPI anchored protein [Teratosphaeria destructans]|uniref:GPI anchored protein n=1 Tax=Teratosphaeria destructans TaxID=418781 RepID=A0A9W7W0J2_9PEZI|nr:GPI anchored protein [Teratosphaeria destructans]
MLRKILITLGAASISSAHFILQWPPTAGFDDEAESKSPCGDATITVNSSSPEVQVSQFAVSIKNTHPTGQWQFRATTDTQEPYNFTDIVPVVNSTGIGDFCLPNLRAPDDFAGKAGILQVIDNSPDGLLYQCAPVNFVTGSNSTVGSACMNATGFTASWTTEESLSTNATTSGTASSSAATATKTSSSSADAVTAAGLGSLVGAFGLLVGLLV